ncbi:imidazole glycerol phosphate synthase subunit HisH [Alteromonadaceae bacterium M269]|nr:imidazole glycerol phosphate synthase subunit HisH [Alteromonadaceae bacterium M269]
MSENLVIVNTGCANISSVRYAIERLGYAVEVSEDVNAIKNASKVFLPGVGTASAAMSEIRRKELEATIQSLSQPVLGICLGMQLMTSSSEEGDASCLGLIEAQVKRMKVGDLRLPHMGWNKIKAQKDNLLFDGLDGEYFYFVHSYSVGLGDYTLASCDYAAPFSASIGQNNFYGVQFHPERSSHAGARLLQNFIENA